MDSEFKVDQITALFVFHPTTSSRNRQFTLHASAHGSLARRRAIRIRGLLRQLTGSFGPARQVDIQKGAHGEFLLRYSLAKVAYCRSVHLSEIDLSILRVALERAGLRLMPQALAVKAADRDRVNALLGGAWLTTPLGDST